MAGQAPVLVMVLKGYPRISETFISNEILLLERLGFSVRIVSMEPVAVAGDSEFFPAALGHLLAAPSRRLAVVDAKGVVVGLLTPAQAVRAGGDDGDLADCTVARAMESHPGKGSVFWLTCPFESAAVAPSAPCAHPSEPAEGVMPRLRFLLAEDNRINRIFAQDLLTSRGHEVVTAEDGRATLDYLARHPVDIVLMDIQMPVMFLTSRYARGRPRWSASPSNGRKRSSGSLTGCGGQVARHREAKR